MFPDPCDFFKLHLLSSSAKPKHSSSTVSKEKGKQNIFTIESMKPTNILLKQLKR